MGIEPESLPKIFDAFEQGGLMQLGGLGLGLAISKTLVEAHNGTITAESEGRNKGAKFTLTFATSKIVDAQTAPSYFTADRRNARRCEFYSSRITKIRTDR